MTMVDPPPGDSRELLHRIAEGAGIPSNLPPVPYQADRYAKPGEMCRCGFAAVVAYETRGYGTLCYCGGRHG